MPHAPIINITHDHQALNRFQEDRSILEIPQREFSNDALMYAHLVALEQINQNRLSFPQMIDPDVRVNEDSHACSRLRGAASAAASLPPSAASCRPLSIRTRSSTASLINADRSLTPVSSSARASRSSSSVTVVLMATSTPILASYQSPFDAHIGSPGNTINRLSHGNSPQYAKPTSPGGAKHHPAGRDKARWPTLSKAVDVHPSPRPHTGTKEGRPRTRTTDLAQSAVHFAHIGTFSAIFSEVDCSLGHPWRQHPHQQQSRATPSRDPANAS